MPNLHPSLDIREFLTIFGQFINVLNYNANYTPNILQDYPNFFSNSLLGVLYLLIPKWILQGFPSEISKLHGNVSFNASSDTMSMTMPPQCCCGYLNRK